jgi:hypothetical protein
MEETMTDSTLTIDFVLKELLEEMTQLDKSQPTKMEVIVKKAAEVALKGEAVEVVAKEDQ